MYQVKDLEIVDDNNRIFLRGQLSHSYYSEAQNKKFYPTKSNLCTIYNSPTSNCQLYSIAAFNSILLYENTLDMWKIIQKRVMKPLILIDLNYTYINKLEKLVPASAIISKQLYVSTNGSNMCIFLVKTAFLN